MTAPIGVVLAAGNGTRMRPLTTRWPKPLLPVCNEPLMVHQLRLLRQCGIERVVVVIGYLGDAVRAALGDGGRWGVHIEYVWQPSLEGIAHALGQVRGRAHGPFVVTLADIYFVTASLEPALRAVARDADAVLLSKRTGDPAEIRRNFEIVEGAPGLVAAVEEKPRNPVSGLKGCGLYVFTPRIFDAIDRTPRSALRNEIELTDAIQVMIDDGARVLHHPIVEADINVTTPSDLLAANRRELQRRGARSLVGQGVRVDAAVALDEVILGERTCIEQPVSLRRCVVLPDTRVRAEGVLDMAVVGPDGIVSCSEGT